MNNAKERAEQHRQHIIHLERDRGMLGGPKHALYSDIALLLSTVGELVERLERTEAAAATLRTQLQQEREAREELAAVWAEAWDRRHEP